MHRTGINTVKLNYSSVYDYFDTQVFVQLFHVFTCATLIIVIYKYFKSQWNFESSGDGLPEIKTPFYSIYGILRAIPSQSTMKALSLGPTTYLQQIFSGLAVLFPKEKAVRARIGLQTLILLKKSDSVEEFLCNNVLITKPFKEVLLPFFGDGLFLSAGEKWKMRRRLLTPMFHYDNLKKFVPMFDQQSKVLVDVLNHMHHEPWIDVVHPLALCAMDIICETFLGINVAAQKGRDSKFVKAMVRVTQTMVERVLNPLYRFEVLFKISKLGQRFEEDIAYLREYAYQAIKQRKEERELRKRGLSKSKSSKCDILDFILDYEEKHPEVPESDVDIRDELMSFIFAGEDTTAAALGWTLYLIGLHPEVQRKIHEELDGIFGDDHDRPVTADDLKHMCYLDCVLKESQRLYPSVPFNCKYALEDCSLSEYKIKKGTIVVVDAYDLHRNPEIFPNPEVFDPDRFLPENCAGRSPYAYVPFSGGARSCIGRRFAIMEAKTVVGNVMRYFSLKSLDPRDKINISFEIILRSSQPLKVKFTPRDTKKC